MRGAYLLLLFLVAVRFDVPLSSALFAFSDFLSVFFVFSNFCGYNFGECYPSLKSKDETFGEAVFHGDLSSCVTISPSEKYVTSSLVGHAE